MKRYLNTSLVYAILAMVGGVFYREFTKFNGFTGKTTLAVVHTHYFLLGMLFFLLLLLLEKSFAFTTAKTGKAILTYQVGLNIRRDDGGARRGTGAGHRVFQGDQCCDLRHCRHRAHPAGRQHGAGVAAAQAQRPGKPVRDCPEIRKREFCHG